MTSSRRRFAAAGNRIGVFLHRAAGGRLDAFGDTTVLMITSPGRRTGMPRSTMVRYLEDDGGGYLVWGTASGAPHDPDWFRNLRHTPRARIEIGRDAQDVDAEELTGAERDRVWREVVLARAPGVARYERKAGRVIPVARLTPVRPA